VRKSTSTTLKAHSKVAEWIQYIDERPDEIRPVHFFFYADEEGDCYRIAHELKNLDFKIIQVMKSLNKQWLCLAEMDLVPDPPVMDLCTELLHKVAENHNVVYDGWETRIDL
jgi:hypothetical protein